MVNAPLSAGKLHVPGSRGFFTRSGDLLRKVRSWDHLLRHRNAVVLRKDHLELTTDALIAVDLLSHLVDRADDILCKVVARRCLRGEDEDARCDVQLRIVEQTAIKRQDMKQVQVLALVFV